MTAIVFAVLVVNLLLAIFNMLPIPPLDGGTVLAGLLPSVSLPASIAFALRVPAALRADVLGRLQRRRLDPVILSHTLMAHMKPRVVSGMRPTGGLHLGHYHGALKNWVRLQDDYDCFYFVADWHALTTHYEERERRWRTLRLRRW